MQSRSLARELALLVLGQIPERESSRLKTLSLERLLQRVLILVLLSLRMLNSIYSIVSVKIVIRALRVRFVSIYRLVLLVQNR